MLMPNQTLFITGTDTHVGKTTLAALIMNELTQRKQRTLGYKPVASGAQKHSSGTLQNADGLILQRAGSVAVSYPHTNPYVFQPAIAPHIAAQQTNTTIKPSILDAGLKNLQTQCDYLIVEGAGGWRLPLSDDYFLSDWVIQHHLPVLLVVGGRLGCLNHALLTTECILADGGKLVGWVFNQIEAQMASVPENIQTLKNLLPTAYLGALPYIKNTNSISMQSFVYWDRLLTAIKT